VVKLVRIAVGSGKAHREIARYTGMAGYLFHGSAVKVLVGPERIQNLIDLDLNHERRLSRNRCNATICAPCRGGKQEKTHSEKSSIYIHFLDML